MWGRVYFFFPSSGFQGDHLTWLHGVGDHVLWSVHYVHIGLQGPVEGLNLMQGDVQHRVSGGVVVVYFADVTLRVNADQKIQKDKILVFRTEAVFI